MGDPPIVERDHAAIISGAEKQPMMGTTTPEQPILLGCRLAVSLPPDVVAVVGCQSLERRSGNDRHAVRVVESQPGLQNVLRPKAHHESARRRELLRSMYLVLREGSAPARERLRVHGAQRLTPRGLQRCVKERA